MAYLAEQIREARQRIADRRLSAVESAEERRCEVEAKSPEISQIDAALAKTARRIFEISAAGPDGVREKIEKLRKENEELLSERRAILDTLGYPGDYTEIRYTCPICQDTGYDGTRMCACLKRELVAEGFRASGIGRLIEKQSFENFSLDYYRSSDKDYALMEQTLEAAKEFAETVPPQYGNLLMMGGTGLGKTHLSTAIARRVIERGYEVRYENAQNVIAAYEHDRFRSGRDGEDERSAIYLDAELLILDDLGTELVNSFSVSAIYHLLNTRINREKPTIISTNLMQEELQAKYSDRIFSRLLGEYRILLFKGTNVRYLKK